MGQPRSECRETQSRFLAERVDFPVRYRGSNAEHAHPLFVTYTEIKNMCNFPVLLEHGESVLLSEKLHGMQCWLGSIEGEQMATPKQLRRKRPEEDRLVSSIYWFPFSLEPVRMLVEE